MEALGRDRERMEARWAGGGLTRHKVGHRMGKLLPSPCRPRGASACVHDFEASISKWKVCVCGVLSVCQRSMLLLGW